jgi:lipopolysaccharide cholinephosphotransferase
MEDMRILHNNIFYVAKFFDKFCEKHELDYFLLGGTALGAARHQGFIPWDDDFDVCMKVDDYERLLSLKKEIDKSGFYLQVEDTVEWPLFFSKLRLDNSLYLEKEDRGRDMHNGVYIDIMCVSPGYDNKMLRFSQYLAAKILSASALRFRAYETDSFWKSIALNMAGAICRGSLKEKLFGYVRRSPLTFASGEFYNHFFGRAPFSKAFINQKHLFRFDIIEFEGYKFRCMRDINGYLECRFGGDWSEMPSKEVRDSFPAHCLRFKSHPNLNTPLL